MAVSEHELIDCAETVTNITHNLPEALKSAQAVGLAIYLSRNNGFAEDMVVLVYDYSQVKIW